MPDTRISPESLDLHTERPARERFTICCLKPGERSRVGRNRRPRCFKRAKNLPQTFVVIGSVRRAFEEGEIEDLLEWFPWAETRDNDREPPTGLIVTTINWQVTPDQSEDLMAFGVIRPIRNK